MIRTQSNHRAIYTFRVSCPASDSSTTSKGRVDMSNWSNSTDGERYTDEEKCGGPSKGNCKRPPNFAETIATLAQLMRQIGC